MTSKIQVDAIQTEENTAVEFSLGAIVPSGQTISGSGGVSVVGVMTATSFVGDGSGLTGVQFATVARSIAYSILLE